MENVLEKILEEIKEVEKKFVAGHEVLFALGATGLASEIEEIIRSHMDEVENDGWIPVVEERFPKEKVLAQDKYGEMLIGYIAYDSDMEWFECEDEGVYLTNVVAWQPLPKKYEPLSK